MAELPPLNGVMKVDVSKQPHDGDGAAVAPEPGVAITQISAALPMHTDGGVTFVGNAAPSPDIDPEPPLGAEVSRRGDRIFRTLTSGASGFVILLVLLIAAFLLVKAIPSIVDD